MKRTLKFGLSLFLIGLILAIAPQSLGLFNPEFNLRILHTNDHHAHLDAISTKETQLGGIAQRKTLIDQLKSENPRETLLLDAGDIFQGTLYFNQYLGQADLSFYNQMNYQAGTLGNHEFDRGQGILADFIKKAKFPLVSANLKVADYSPLKNLVKPWIILSVNGEKIGIFGLTVEETAKLSSPGEGVSFTNTMEATKKAVAELKQQGINKIIGLTHIGFESDLNLARNIDDIDIIIGGHSHTPLGSMPNATQPYPVVTNTPNGKTVLVVTDWEWGKYLGDLKVKFNRQGDVISWQGSPHAIDNTIPPDASFAKQLEAFSTPLEILRQTIIGKTDVLLDGSRDKIRTQETNLGNLIADAILNKFRPDGAQIAIVNGGGIRSSIPPGQISVSQVIEVLPFGNTIGRLDLTGEQIKQALEHGVSQVELGEGRFPQVAGLRFIYDPKAPVGSRVLSIFVVDQTGQEKPLNLTTTYRVITNSFMLNGGDGYEVMKAGKNSVDTGFLFLDVVIDYIKQQSNINVKSGDRIIVKQSL
ncbi:bifunctional metallophosphatase/5'-nucleotidase [Planktothrix pseudagardhii]|uniref:Trifunctional nucleotide phosphoesterase protein YfkN n=1 Tax=Planktothrix pseudagardhii TaxID=132604 RepID=A0A9W4CTH1_9CYAN|nr:5'-nucleotidase C-terminal domain-containing protein [Planktothrix pseudagardhii]CAD5963875.1 Trifunctional nucleotide phosphoesterase protein YfkN [Planktothrix pseudagardhii]